MLAIKVDRTYVVTGCLWNSLSCATRPLTRYACSKHILNAQVSIRAPCCQKWFDCSQCHAEVSSHPLAKTAEMTFICKKCKKAFRKDMEVYEESDEYCPHCDNHYVSPSSWNRGGESDMGVIGD